MGLTRLHTPPSPPPSGLTPTTIYLSRPSRIFGSSAHSLSRISLHSNGVRSLSHARSSNPTADVIDEAEEAKTDDDKLKRRIEALGVNCDSCTPGQYDLLYCPKGRNTEKMLYGLDDISEADEIIIVEGEIDKLSVEEAGYHNCVSVPGGAPQTVSLKELPSPDKDTSFQYLWNCKDYLDKASRIILATDGDTPGQALAEELARRLGKERCRRVHWPKKDEVSSFKDANEVQML